MDEINEKLQAFLDGFLELQEQLGRAEKSHGDSELIKGVVGDYISDKVKDSWGVQKQHSKKVQQRFSKKFETSPRFRQIDKDFKDELGDLKSFISTISLKTKSLTPPGNSDKLLRKFNIVDQRSRLDSKIKNAINILEAMINSKYIYNSEIPKRRQKRRTKKSASATSSDYPYIEFGKFKMKKGTFNLIMLIGAIITIISFIIFLFLMFLG